jgi:hypothetical protein
MTVDPRGAEGEAIGAYLGATPGGTRLKETLEFALTYNAI